MATLLRAVLGLSALGFGAGFMGMLPSWPTVQPATEQAASTENSASSTDSDLHRVFYQASASLSDSLPALPNGLPDPGMSGGQGSSSLPALPAFPGGSALPNAGALPSPGAYPSAGADSVVPAPLPAAPSGGVALPNAVNLNDNMPQGSSSRTTNNSGLPGSSMPIVSSPSPTLPAPNLPVNPGAGGRAANPLRDSQVIPASQPQVLPGPMASQPEVTSSRAPQGSARSILPSPSAPTGATSLRNTSLNARGVPATTAAAPQTQSGVRVYDDQSGRAAPGSSATVGGAYVNGPPFVAPPSRSRYYTTPYNHALFQTAAFQRTSSQNVPATTATTGVRTQAGQLASTNVANNATLPQFQNAPGIYPTASYQCVPGSVAPSLPPSLPPPGAVPGTSIPATITPNLAPNYYSPYNQGYAPLISLGQEGYNVQLGRGILGQPTVYVPGQPVRNFLRYLFP
ncbi:MAG: hypothetical protein AAF483_16955 [Planctomycetota bacterium]